MYLISLSWQETSTNLKSNYEYRLTFTNLDIYELQIAGSVIVFLSTWSEKSIIIILEVKFAH